MNDVTKDPAVKCWIERLKAVGATVPDTLDQTSMRQLLMATEGNPAQQHVAAHLAFHVHSARICVEPQLGQSDPQPQQVAQ